MAPALFVDGRPAAALPLPDRGLAYGDGIFETMLARGRHIAWVAYHADRLRRGLAALAIPEPAWEGQLRDALSDAVADHSWRSVRLTVTRGDGPRGYGPPADAVPRTIIEIGEGHAAPPGPDRPLRTGLASLQWSRQPRLAGLKHLNRLEQVLAATECRERALDDLIVAGSDGWLASTTVANLFLLRDGELLTPPVDGCGIAGTRRRLVLEELAPALGLHVRVRPLGIGELAAAEAAFCCNSLRGVAPLGSFEERQWSEHDVLARLRRHYDEALHACAA